MYRYSTRVVFACRQCKASFEKVDEFIEHKKEKHSVEFRTSNCIVFEDVLILNTNTDDDDSDSSSMLSTVNVETQKEAPLNDLTFGVDLILSTRDTPHDPADTFDPLSTSAYDSQNDDCRANASYQDNDILQENHDNYQVVDSSQVPADVSYDFIVPGMELVEFEIDCANNSVASVDLNQSPQNPFVLLKRLSPKEIQNLSCIQTQETIKMEVTPESRCEICLQEYNSEAKLEVHSGVCILDHDNNGRDLDLYCSPCNKFFKSKWARNIHQIRLHETEEEQRSSRCKFKCTVCPKVYWRKDSLMHHMDSHRQTNYQKKRVKCDQCSSSFRDKCDLKRHYQAKHTPGRTSPLLCPELGCGKSFKLQIYLQSHLKHNHSKTAQS